MTPESLCSAAVNVRIVALRVEVYSILGRDTAAEALPRVSIAKVAPVCLNQNNLLACVDAGGIRGCRGSDELNIDNDMVSIGSEIACLELGPGATDTARSVGVDFVGASSFSAVCYGWQWKLDDANWFRGWRLRRSMDQSYSREESCPERG
jgi:hypothetical protein